MSWMNVERGQRKYRLTWGFLVFSYAFGGLCMWRGADLVSASAFCGAIGAALWGTAREMTKEHGRASDPASP